MQINHLREIIEKVNGIKSGDHAVLYETFLLTFFRMRILMVYRLFIHILSSSIFAFKITWLHNRRGMFLFLVPSGTHLEDVKQQQLEQESN